MIKKLSVLIFTLLISIVAVIAQTTETVCSDFETSDDQNTWTLVNGSQTNQWVFGTAANDGTSLYISNSPSSTTPPNSYTSTATRVWAYRDFQFPACNNEFVLKFDWRCYGEATSELLDFMYVLIGPPVEVEAGQSAGQYEGLTHITNPINGRSDHINWIFSCYKVQQQIS